MSDESMSNSNSFIAANVELTMSYETLKFINWKTPVLDDRKNKTQPEQRKHQKNRKQEQQQEQQQKQQQEQQQHRTNANKYY